MELRFRQLSAALIVVLVGTVLAQEVDRSEGLVRLLNSCDSYPECIEMTLNYGREGPEGVLLKRERLEGGYADFTLQIQAGLPGNHSKPYRVVFRGFVDGIECSDFGQGNVAVLGFSRAGNPIVLTSAGRLEIHGESVQVGCPRCAKLLERESKKVRFVLRTPSWDLSLVVPKEDYYLTYDAEGHLYFFKAGRCLRLVPNEPIRRAKSNACSRPTEIGNFTRPVSGIALEPGDWLYDVPSTPFLLLLHDGACT